MKDKEIAEESKGMGYPVMWKVNTPGLLHEITINLQRMGVLFQPLNIFQNILRQVSDRCVELRDPLLDALMCRLALYQESDMNNPDYDGKMVEAAMRLAYGKGARKGVLFVPKVSAGDRCLAYTGRNEWEPGECVRVVCELTETGGDTPDVSYVVELDRKKPATLFPAVATICNDDYIKPA